MFHVNQNVEEKIIHKVYKNASICIKQVCDILLTLTGCGGGAEWLAACFLGAAISSTTTGCWGNVHQTFNTVINMRSATNKRGKNTFGLFGVCVLSRHLKTLYCEWSFMVCAFFVCLLFFFDLSVNFRYNVYTNCC